MPITVTVWHHAPPGLPDIPVSGNNKLETGWGYMPTPAMHDAHCPTCRDHDPRQGQRQRHERDPGGEPDRAGHGCASTYAVFMKS